MFDPDFAFDVPTVSSLLAEVGIRPEHVREVVEDDRAIRCPERGADYPIHGFASLAPDSSLERDLHEPGPGELRDPASALSPAGQRRRRA
ncbi:MAG: hypothetical protein OXH59_16430 [Rhodospirillaceae bacterium]|nr:hypothetical protein [Rhodospirillaceae bacterium]